MKKLERYDISDFGYVPCSDGDVCKSEDVVKLEAINAELLEALEGMAGLFERDDWIYVGLSIKHRVIAAHAAIAKAKGEEP